MIRSIPTDMSINRWLMTWSSIFHICILQLRIAPRKKAPLNDSSGGKKSIITRVLAITIRTENKENILGKKDATTWFRRIITLMGFQRLWLVDCIRQSSTVFTDHELPFQVTNSGKKVLPSCEVSVETWRPVAYHVRTGHIWKVRFSLRLCAKFP